MKWKVVKKRGRYHLYIWENDDWKFHKSYLTEKVQRRQPLLCMIVDVWKTRK